MAGCLDNQADIVLPGKIHGHSDMIWSTGIDHLGGVWGATAESIGFREARIVEEVGPVNTQRVVAVEDQAVPLLGHAEASSDIKVWLRWMTDRSWRYWGN